MQPVLLTYQPDIERLLKDTKPILETPDVLFVDSVGQVTEIVPANLVSAHTEAELNTIYYDVYEDEQ